MLYNLIVIVHETSLHNCTLYSTSGAIILTWDIVERVAPTFMLCLGSLFGFWALCALCIIVSYLEAREGKP